MSIKENIQTHLDKNELTAGVFIDLRKAFDTVDHDILLTKLDQYVIRGLSNDWFRSYLTGRQQLYPFVTKPQQSKKYYLECLKDLFYVHFYSSSTLMTSTRA